MSVSRRLLLQGAGSALALAATRRARAANGLINRNVPGAGAFKILEIHFAGGLNHRETFWVERPDEAPVKRALHNFDPTTNATVNPSGAPATWTSWVAGMNAYETNGYKVGTSSGGTTIHLGPCGRPMVTSSVAIGAPLLSRMRVVATGETNPAHAVAQSWMLQGQPLNSARASGIGAAVMRQTSLPSFVFFNSNSGLSQTAANAAMATGFHGGSNAPYLVPFDNPAIVSLLADPRVPQRDALSKLYDDRYEEGLTFADPAGGGRARSVALDRYLASIGGAFNGAALSASLGALSASSANVIWDNGTRRAIKASASLLASGLSAYCCVCDPGLSKGYDLHSSAVNGNTEHAALNTSNVLNVLRTIREEVDAGTIDLDETLVVLSTEFGREYLNVDGSEHGYHGFAVALLGGPIEAGAGGVVGDLPFTPADDGNAGEASPPAYAAGGVDGTSVGPTDLRAAIALAAGIHPFQNEVYQVSEAHVGPLSADQAADALASHIFGT